MRRGTVLAVAGAVASLFFVSTVLAATVFTDSFGAVDSNTIAGWTEDDGAAGGTEIKAAEVAGNNSASPDGGAFARANGNGGWFCRTIDATAFGSLQMSYYWRGDNNAEGSDDGIVEYKATGACSDAAGWTTLQNHDLSVSGSWTTQSIFALPGALDGTSFLIGYRADSNQNNEDFRVDGVTITGSFLDTTPPSVTNVTASTADGAYNVPDVVTVEVTFSEPVNVTGTPQLTLETGATDRLANYSGGTGTATLTFTYTVQTGDTSADLDYVSTSALALNGGTIQDAALNNASLTLVGPGTPGSLGANKALVIDTTAPADPVLASIATDNYINASEAASVLFVGTGEPNASIEIAVQGFVATVYVNLPDVTGTVLLDGTFSLSADFTGVDDNSVATQIRVIDAAGNASAWVAGPSASKDVIAPTVTDLSASVTPTNTSPVSFSITFSESVIGFDATDVVVGGVGGTVSNMSAGPTSYTFDVTPSSEGAFTVDVAASAATDAAGNTSGAAVTENAIYDVTAPSVSFTSGPTHLSYINVPNATFGFTATDALSTPVTTECRLLPDPYAGCTSPHNLVGLTDGLKVFRVRATDAATNVSPFVRVRFTVDTVAPTVTLTTATLYPVTTAANPILFTAQFSETVTGFDSGDITVTNGTVSAVTGSGATYGIEITPTSDGQIDVSIVGSAAVDLALNPSGSSATVSVHSDTSAPVMTLGGVTPTYMKVNDPFVDLGATALDGIDGALLVTTVGTVDHLTIGDYVMTYSATDAAGNTGSVTRDVYVRASCSDMADNDSDGLIDSADPGCHTDNDASNGASYAPLTMSESNVFGPGGTGGATTGGGGGGNGPVLGAFNNVVAVPAGITPAVLGVQTTGEVLGAQTTATCAAGPYLTAFLGRGKANPADQVTKLQEFLNQHLGLTIPVNGVFGPQTLAGVNQFQLKHSVDVLTPWGITVPTGIVYQTTLRKINMIACPELTFEMPALVEWASR
jgi:hypothetical protein